jgi:predicted PhzF superfamily epimerase YddE/YHI9
VIGPHRAEADTRFELRAFFTEGTEPLREDPVTGSLNAAAAQWLLASGRASAPYVAAQGTALGRRGRIHITTEAERIWVGGRTNVVLSGTAAL